MERRQFFIMVSSITLCCLLSGLVLGQAWGGPVSLQSDSHPLTLVSDLTSRLNARPSRLQDALLPLPSSQDLEAIKKVAQILVMLGQQVIPAIIGEPVPPPAVCEPASVAGGGGGEIPNDPVNFNDRQA